MKHTVGVVAVLVGGSLVAASAGQLRQFAPGSVAVGGEIGRRMDVTLEKMLHHTDIDGVFARHFRNRKEKPDEPGGFAGYGMFLDALVKAAAHGVGGDEAVCAKTRLLKELGGMQTPDGRISMFSGKPGFWDNHEGAYMIQALCLDHRWFGTEDSLATARRLADSLIAHDSFPTLGSETAYLLLYEETRDRKYLDWVERVANISDGIDEYDRNVKVNGVQHVYTWLARALAQLQYDPRLCAAADEAFRRARGDYLSVTGSITGQPHWGELWDNTQVGLGKWGETCASAYLMRLAAKRIESSPDPHLGDLYERVMYNAFFSAQSADGLKYRYWTPFNECPPWYDRGTYCCPNNYKRAVFEIPDAVYYRGDDCLVVNLYAQSRLDAEGFFADMRTEYPDDGVVNLRVRMDARRLRLRIPAWCDVAEVRVADEKPVAAKPGWFDVVRDFSKPVDLQVNLPMNVRLVAGTRAQHGLVAVMRGPCVYALDAAANGVRKQNCDLWRIDASRPPRWDKSRRGVVVLAEMLNRQHERRELLFTRYSSDSRDRTFFPALGTEKTVKDELK